MKVTSNGFFVYVDDVWTRLPLESYPEDWHVFLKFPYGSLPTKEVQDWLLQNGEILLESGEYRLKLAPALPSNDIKQVLTLSFNGLLDGLIPMTDLRPSITVNQSGIFLGAPETTEGDESVSTIDTETIDTLEFLLAIFALLLEGAEAFPVYINIPLGE
jgi:hypothetical protein